MFSVTSVASVFSVFVRSDLELCSREDQSIVSFFLVEIDCLFAPENNICMNKYFITQITLSFETDAVTA